MCRNLWRLHYFLDKHNSVTYMLFCIVYSITAEKTKKNEKTDFFFLYCLCTPPDVKAALYHESGTSPDAAVHTGLNKQ